MPQDVHQLKTLFNLNDSVKELALQRDNEKRAADLKYENGLSRVIPNRCDSVITQLESEYETLFFPFKIIPFYYC
jgi:hypothetical protein